MEEKIYSKQDIERALEALKALDPEHPLAQSSRQGWLKSF